MAKLNNRSLSSIVLSISLSVLSMGARSPAPEPPTGFHGPWLSGRTIVIDPGHGGRDPGSIGSRSREDKINLELATQLAKWFHLAGASVVMTWSQPSEMPPHRRFNVRQRVAVINRSHADVLIDIHCNAGGPYWGPQTFYWSGDPSYTLATMIQQELQFFTGTRRQVNRIDQYVLRYANMPAVNVEAGFISNASEEKKLMSPSYQRQLTWYIFIGTERWFLRARWPSAISREPSHVEMLQR